MLTLKKDTMPKRTRQTKTRQRGCGVYSNMQLVGHPRTMTGEGFFDDVWSGIKSAATFVGEKVIPKVIDVGLPILAKAAMGGGGALARKRRRKH